MLLIKRCKIQRSIYHAKVGSRERSKTAWWESQEDNGMQNHAPHKHIFRDPMILTWAPLPKLSFLAWTLFKLIPQHSYFCYRKSSWLSCSYLEPWPSSLYTVQQVWAREESSPSPSAHTEGAKQSQSPSWLHFQTLLGVFPFYKCLIIGFHCKSDSWTHNINQQWGQWFTAHFIQYLWLWHPFLNT